MEDFLDDVESNGRDIHTDGVTGAVRSRRNADLHA